MFEPRVSLPDHFAVTDGRWFVLDERNQLLLVAGAIPTGAEPPTGETARHLLGIADGRPAWTIVAPKYADVGEDGEWVDLRSLYGRIDEVDWVLAGRAVQVVAWDRDHKFCSRCGTEAQDHPMDRAKQCPRCRLVSYSLMVGFQARWASGEIQIDDDEIVEAAWYGPDELPPVPRGGMSIAGWLIEDWLRRSANASRPA
jgi:NADH pyrophosphatase NudC (nudix superfamily)